MTQGSASPQIKDVGGAISPLPYNTVQAELCKQKWHFTSDALARSEGQVQQRDLASDTEFAHFRIRSRGSLESNSCGTSKQSRNFQKCEIKAKTFTRGLSVHVVPSSPCAFATKVACPERTVTGVGSDRSHQRCNIINTACSVSWTVLSDHRLPDLYISHR